MLVRKNPVLRTFAKAVKEDAVGGSLLIDEVVYNWLADEADALRPQIQELLIAASAEKLAVAKQSLAKSYVAATADGVYPDESFHKAAEWLGAIGRFLADVASNDVSKSDRSETWTINGRSIRRMVGRDAHGRFTRDIDQNTVRDPLTAARPSGRLMPAYVVRNKDKVGYTDAANSLNDNQKIQLARHQSQWEQAGGAVRDIYSTFGSDQDKVDVHLVVVGNGKARDVSFSLATGRKGLPDNVDIDPLNDTIQSIQVSTNDPAMAPRVAQFNSMASVGGLQLARIAQVPNDSWMQSLGRYDLDPSNGSRLTQFFNRLSAGADVLNAVPGAEKVASAARLIGNMGPEAERVLSPYVRQAAYRYRGTEKEPDLALVTEFNSQEMNWVDATAEQGAGSLAARELEAQLVADRPGQRARADIVAGSAAYRIAQARRNGAPFTPDELKLQVRSDVAARHMMTTLPDDPFVAEVSRAAGDVLPSQGVLIDADGDVVSQAVGYADDHYLPFDLKNLAALQGGQYVRTRVQGGLTAEDIYTSVAMGARMATVVSSSGVFSIEFDPNFRGARANSDKAHQMYQRYIKILDAVDGSKLYTQDLSPAMKTDIRRQAAALSDNDKDAEELAEQMMERARRESMQLSETEIAALEDAARRQVEEIQTPLSTQQRARMIEDVFNEKVAEAQSSKVQQLRLNSEGYKVALETLQQQFPYFIRSVSYEPLGGKKGGFLESRGQDTRGGARQRSSAEDKGYVLPGGLRPDSVKSGYYRTAREPRAKSGRSTAIEETLPAPEGATLSPDSASTTDSTPTSGSASSTASGAAASKAPAKGIASRIQSMAPLLTQQRDAELNKFINALPAAGLDRAGFGITSWESVRDNNVNALKFLIGRNVSDFASLLNDDGDRVVEILSDTTALSKLIRDSLVGVGSSDYFDTGGRILGAANSDDAAVALRNSAQTIIDLTRLLDPFQPVTADGGNAKPMAFDDIVALDTPDKFKAFKSANPELADMAVQLGWDEKTGSYLPMGVVATSAKTLIDGYSRLAVAVEHVKQQIRSSGGDVSFSPNEALGSAGLTAEQAGQILGKPGPITNVADLANANVTTKIQDIQRAWSLVTTARLLQALGEGGVLPKAEDAVLMKSEAARWSRQVRVVSKSDPLAMEVARRRAAGLPFVPTRVK